MTLVLGLLLAPLLAGVIGRTKALFAGRRGPPLLQPYYELRRLAAKGAVYSRTTTWVFRAGPIVGLAAAIVAAAIVPLGGSGAFLSFPGDLVVVVYLFALSRFFTVLAALDTGSAFEGMGASRECLYGALAEPATLLGLAVLARITGHASLADVYAAIRGSTWGFAGGELTMIAGAFLVVFLAENARIPFDDPATHLELTMVHEVMILDHGGPDLAFLEYAAALKMWILGALLVGLVVPVRTGVALLDGLAGALGLLVLAALVGVVESGMARLRLPRVPQMLVGATALAAIAMILVLAHGVPS